MHEKSSHGLVLRLRFVSLNVWQSTGGRTFDVGKPPRSYQISVGIRGKGVINRLSVTIIEQEKRIVLASFALVRFVTNSTVFRVNEICYGRPSLGVLNYFMEAIFPLGELVLLIYREIYAVAERVPYASNPVHLCAPLALPTACDIVNRVLT